MAIVKCPLCGKESGSQKIILVKLKFKKKHTGRYMSECLEKASVSYSLKNGVFDFSLDFQQFLDFLKKDHWFREVFVMQKNEILSFIYLRCGCLATYWPIDPSPKSWKI